MAIFGYAIASITKYIKGNSKKNEDFFLRFLNWCFLSNAITIRGVICFNKFIDFISWIQSDIEFLLIFLLIGELFMCKKWHI